MLQVHDSKLYRDDGTPRRKYEIDEASQSRTGITVAVVLAIGSAFSLLKNALFPWSTNQGAPPPTNSPEQAPGPVDDTQAHHVETAAEEATPDSSFTSAALPRSRVGSSSGYYSTTLEAEAKPPKLAIVHVNQLRSDALPADRSSAAPTLRLVESSAEGLSKSGGTSAPGGNDADDRTSGNRRANSTGVVTLGPLLFNAHLVLRAAELLRHTSDPDGDQLSIKSISASSGKLSLRPDGSWHFLPDYDDPRDVVFRYSVSDGAEAVWQEAHLSFEPPDAPTIHGTPESDTLTGTAVAEVFQAGDGDDLIVGRGGQDVIYGGAGNDRIFGGDQDDVVWAGDGDDIVRGGGGNDALYGEGGNDVLHGEDGDDLVDGGAGSDLLLGDNGDDVLVGGAGNDTLDGGSGRDILDAGAGDDIVHLYSDGAVDIIDGGDGSDTLAFGPVVTEGDTGFIASIALGVATERLVKASTSAAATSLSQGATGSEATTPDVKIDLADGIITIGTTETDTITNFENVVVGDISVAVIGNDDGNVIQTGAGNDIIDSGDGADIVAAGAGNDVLRVVADGASDHFDGGDGVDTLTIEPVLAGSNSQAVISVPQEGVASRGGEELVTSSASEFSRAEGSSQNPTAAAFPMANPWTIADLADCVMRFDDVEADAGQNIGTVVDQDVMEVVPGSHAANGNTLGQLNEVVEPGESSDVIEANVDEDFEHETSDDDFDIFDDGHVSESTSFEPLTIPTNDVADVSVAFYDELTQGAPEQPIGSILPAPSMPAMSAAIVPDVKIDLSEGVIEFRGGETDTILNFENVLVADLSAVVIGNDAANVITTGSGDDIIEAGGGADIVDTGDGDDRIRVSRDGVEDKFYGGEGVDLVDLSSETEGLIIDLIAGEIGFDTETDKIAGIENAHGGSGGDRIVADESVNNLWGGEGDDLFVFVTASTLHNKGKGRDKIWDFEVGDRVQIDDLLHEMHVSDDRKDPRFTLLIGEDQSFKNPGELRFSSIYNTAEESGTQVLSIVLEGNLNRDPNAEFELELSGNLNAITTFLRAAYGEQQV